MTVFTYIDIIRSQLVKNVTANHNLDVFDDPQHALSYVHSANTFMPGYSAVQRMVSVLLGMHLKSEAHVLVHGAGTGEEIAVFAEQHRTWQFTGVEPARAMLDQAQKRLHHFQQRVHYHLGYIDDAPQGPFTGATSMLTLHFLPQQQRIETLLDICKRLPSGAPVIVVHCSIEETSTQRKYWLSCHQNYRIASGVSEDEAKQGIDDLENSLYIYPPEVDLHIMRCAGLNNITQFYSAFTWRGWIGFV